MKWSLLAVLLFAAAMPTFAQDAAAPPVAPTEDREIGALRAPLQQAKEALAAAEEKALLNMQAWYLTNLAKLEAETQAKGNLDHVLLIRKEKERITAHEASTAEQLSAMPAALGGLRASYDGGIKKIRDDAAARWDALARKFLADLEALQVRLTKAGEIDRALAVKTEKEKFMAERPAAITAPAMVAATPRASPFGISQGPKQAKVEVAGAVLAPLKSGESLLGFTTKVHWTEIPDAYRGFQFTRLGVNSETLKFKVLSDGIVDLACTTGWATPTATGWPSEVITEAQLRRNGWHKEPGELKDEETNHGWWVFTRNCKAGEEFSIRNAKYRSPILLVK
jgi:hypothetical protein